MIRKKAQCLGPRVRDQGRRDGESDIAGEAELKELGFGRRIEVGEVDPRRIGQRAKTQHECLPLGGQQLPLPGGQDLDFRTGRSFRSAVPDTADG